MDPEQIDFPLGDDRTLSVAETSRLLFGMSRKEIYECLQVGDLKGIQPNRPLGARTEKTRKDGRASNFQWRVFRESALAMRQRMLEASNIYS